MKCIFALAVAVLFCAGLPGVAQGQRPPVRPAAAQEAKVPGYNTMYCSGFLTDRSLEEGLFILAGEEGGAKTLFTPGDILYLNHGAGWIVNPSGEYMVMRRVKDLVRQEAFVGQFAMLKELGTMYKEVGRIKVDIVHQQSATAHVLRACESISVGDFLIPFDVTQAPPLKVSATLDRFAPPTGKTLGTIVTGKDFVNTLAQRDVAFVDIGSKDGVAVGQYYRIYRPFSDTRDYFNRYSQEYTVQAMGERVGVRLTPEQQKDLPRDVLGEMLILHVEEKTATALVTLILRPVRAGDYVELE